MQNPPQSTPSRLAGARIAHIGIAVDGLAAGSTFYRDVLGLAEVELDDADGAAITGFAAGDSLIELLEARSTGAGRTAFVSLTTNRGSAPRASRSHSSIPHLRPESWSSSSRPDERGRYGRREQNSSMCSRSTFCTYQRRSGPCTTVNVVVRVRLPSDTETGTVRLPFRPGASGRIWKRSWRSEHIMMNSRFSSSSRGRASRAGPCTSPH